MASSIVRVENVSKQYRIGGREAAYETLRESITSAVQAPFRRLQRRNNKRPPQTIWALKDVSFNVARGEVVGLIGRNGAGKSTLLKILSRITEPTEGRVELFGRVASLLEVGTGFHPELTGRENVFLNGAILGMRRAEIARKFDEIVAFSEVEQFLDTPVKYYSSGMYARLAFAVAAHLEPEILIVDEVLAVGDAPFQKKCFGKMGDVARAGQTVLFVSHNLTAVMQFCTRGILLTNGRCVFDGTATAAVAAYTESILSTANAVEFPEDPDKNMQILSVSIVSPDGDVINSQPHTESFCVVIKYQIRAWRSAAHVCLDVFNEQGTRILWGTDASSAEEIATERLPGVYTARVTIPAMVLSPGFYHFTAGIYAPGQWVPFDERANVVSVEVIDGGSFFSNFGMKPHVATMVQLPWETTPDGLRT